MSLQSRTQSPTEADGPARRVRIQLVSESNGSPALAGVADPFPDHCRRSIMALTAQRLPSGSGWQTGAKFTVRIPVSRLQTADGPAAHTRQASEIACSSTPI